MTNYSKSRLIYFATKRYIYLACQLDNEDETSYGGAEDISLINNRITNYHIYLSVCHMKYME